MPERKKTIAVYVPKWLYRNDRGITIFVRGLYGSIKNSGKYRLLKISPSMCAFTSTDQAEAFVKKHNIALVVYHGSRAIPYNQKQERGLDYLETCVPFLNSRSVHVADDKLETKRLLKQAEIPVLPDTIVKDKAGLLGAMVQEKLYVAKPHDRASGAGVKLIKKVESEVREYLDGSWRNIEAKNTKYGLKLSGLMRDQFFLITSMCVFITFCLLFIFSQSYIFTVFAVWALALFAYLYLRKTHYDFTYNPLMLESFFGDGTGEFYCLRCTVLNDKVIEAAKKTNKRNVTPNISHGGKASKTKLSKEQEAMAIAAGKAVGATYSGVDLLVAGGKTIVAEVNVGPIGVYCEQTGVDVGRMFGEYSMDLCDNLTDRYSRKSSEVKKF